MRLIRIFLAIACCTGVAFEGTGFAEPAPKKTYEEFDPKISYDIYFNTSSEETTVLHSVEILGYKEIAGQLFLVVLPNGFNLRDYEGFILFDSITAILPDTNFRVEGS